MSDRELKAKGQGQKFDQNKPDWSLIELQDVEEIVKVLTFGAVKYERENWKRVPNREQRYFAALLRHLRAYQEGEECDSETGLSHLAHAGCCVQFLLFFERDNKKNENKQLLLDSLMNTSRFNGVLSEEEMFNKSDELNKLYTDNETHPMETSPEDLMEIEERR